MKKFVTSVLFISVFSAYALYQHRGGNLDYAAARTPASSNSSASQVALAATAEAVPPATNQTPTQMPAPTPAPAALPRGQYTDGAYVGSAADAYYGTVQVKAMIKGGKLADVQFLQYPNDRSTSRMINSEAMPILRRQAIQAQSANVDGVSGASDTSAAFHASLSAALQQARVS